MTQSSTHNHSTSQAVLAPDALQVAEQRAAAAEHQLEKLQHKIEALEHGPQADSSTPVNNPLSSPASNIEQTESEAVAALRNESMMDHLLNALDQGQDIGHYGRLVFAMVTHHFLSDDATIEWLTKDPTFSRDDANVLLRQVENRDYNPPRRERILAWQREQQFPILPNPEDPDCGNVYRNLKFPQSVYEHIQQYQEEKVHAQGPELFSEPVR